MKKNGLSEHLERASTVIKADRLGVSAGLEGLITGEIKSVLSDYFSLSEDVTTKIELSQNGFNVIIKAHALSVKNVKIVD